MKFINKKGFTLAEIMIVLTIIGIISAIVVPIGINSMPNEKVMKFKKSNSTIGSVIKELASSGEYFKVGDMSKTPNGSAIGAANLCNAMSDILAIKSASCGTGSVADYRKATNTALATIKSDADSYCNSANNNGNKGYFITSDGVVWYDPSPAHTMTSGKYKVFCIDVDGVNYGEAPFGYAIRPDGKLITGARADSWIDLDVRNKN